MNKRLLSIGVGLSFLAGNALAGDCPPATVADAMGIPAGKYPQQYEFAEFEQFAGCKLTFQENPAIAELNRRIVGNPALPPLTERLPEEPLVVAPYDRIGHYGGVLVAMSNAAEAGTSDFLSVRHVNLVRLSDDLQTIVPNVAKGWQWNDNFTELTFFLRKGHKWSDGAPFTAEDVKFWYDDLALDPNVIPKAKDYVLVAGKRVQVEVIDPQAVTFVLPFPKPDLLSHFATSYAQGFQPKHFLGQFHPKHNPDADKLAQSLGFENGYAAVAAYYGNSDWTDTPSPLLAHPNKVGGMPKAVVPTLESHIYVKANKEGRHLVANPYFHIVDTAGNQLPYIGEQEEVYVNENEARLLKLVNAEVDYKSQSVQLPSAPMLLDGREKGDYAIDLRPAISMPTFSFNVTSENLEKRKVFGDLRFRQAMSVAINRDEINEVAFFGLGQPKQYTGFSPEPDFITGEWKQHYAQHDPDLANQLLDEVGLHDMDGDGFRELPSGGKLALHVQFATQGISGKVVELAAQHWSDVGVRTTSKEVTPDEYRSAQSSNQLDVGAWHKGMSLAMILGLNESFVAPFGDYFNHRVGMLWGEYVQTNGEKGVKPPDWVFQMIDDINTFQSTPAGTPESDALGSQLVENLTGNLLMIGTVHAPNSIYHRNALKNFADFKTHSYGFWTYPYRAYQWFLDDES